MLVKSETEEILNLEETNILLSFTETEDFIPIIPYSTCVLKCISLKIIPEDPKEFTKLLYALDYLNYDGMNLEVRKFLNIRKVDCVKIHFDHDGYMLYLACLKGNLTLAESLIVKDIDHFAKNELVFSTFRDNQPQIIELVKTKLKVDEYYLEFALQGACFGGHLDLVEYIVNKGASYFDGGLYKACKGGHLNIAKLMISLGANEFNKGLLGACKGGHLDIIKFMIEKIEEQVGEKIEEYYVYNGWLEIAIERGHKRIIKLLKKRTKKSKINYKKIDRLYYACKTGNLKEAKLLIYDKKKFQYSYKGAIRGGYLDIVEFMNSQDVPQKYLYSETHMDYENMTYFLYEKLIEQYRWTVEYELISKYNVSPNIASFISKGDISEKNIV